MWHLIFYINTTCIITRIYFIKPFDALVYGVLMLVMKIPNASVAGHLRGIFGRKSSYAERVLLIKYAFFVNAIILVNNL
jgi:hypothetical protein